VVIVIMIGFIGGSALPALLRRGQGLNKPVAYFAQKGKITRNDLNFADGELGLLRTLQADELLRWQDLQGLMLGELLFSEQRSSPALINQLRQAIRQNQYMISNKQINDMYRRQYPTRIYWLLLQKEAHLAGIRVPNESAGELLGGAIPQLFNGQTYSKVIGSIVNRRGIPEEQILATVAKLLAVLQYSHIVCSSENVTARQIMHTASLEEEGIDAELVKFGSDIFAETQDEATEGQMAEHFDKYKGLFDGTVSDENPNGFGYKLPDRVRLEYIAVKLEDVQGIVAAPTQDQMVEFYNKHKERLFTEQIPLDPNDPNSPTVPIAKSYAEVAESISEQLLKDKTNSTAVRILQEAKTLTEAVPEGTEVEPGSFTAEQLKEMADEYKTATEQLSQKHNIKVYTGQTGLLSAARMQTDENLATLYLEGYGQSRVPLSQVVFAVDGLDASELGPFDLSKPKMYENIGPARDFLAQMMVVVRVSEAHKASEPESINETFSTSSLEFDPNEEDSDDDVYSVKEKVAEDLKRLRAMQITKSRAEEFMDMAAKDGWDNALAKFNELYGQQEDRLPDDPNVFRLQTLSDLRRMPTALLETLKVQNQGNPAAPFFISERKKERLFVNQLYSLAPADDNVVEVLPRVMEFKPDLSCYVIKSISIKPLYKEQYEKIKAMRLYREDLVQSQSLAAVHFNPENILKRMNFGPAKVSEEPADANSPAESEAAS
jgi:hypothetical protein